MNGKDYPQIGIILQEEMAAFRTRSGRLSLRKIAVGSGVTASALSSWLRGQRALSAVSAERLARFFYKKDEAGRIAFEKRLMAAKQVSGTSALDLVVGGNPPKVAVIDHGCFATSQGSGFLDDLFRRLLLMAGSTRMIPVHADLSTLRESLRARTYDLVLGMLATVDRTAELTFFRTPITLTLNAVVHKPQLRSPEAVQRLKAALTIDEMKNPQEVLHPVFVTAEVGGTYVMKQLGFDKLAPRYFTALTEYDPKHFANAIVSPREDQRIPVAILDEYTAFRVVLEMNGKGQLLFDQKNFHSRTTPRYPYSIGAPRSDERFLTFLREALELLLESDAEYVAQLYMRLRGELREELKGLVSGSMSSRELEAWIEQTLGLSSPGIPIPWQQVITKAKSK